MRSNKKFPYWVLAYIVILSVSIAASVFFASDQLGKVLGVSLFLTLFTGVLLFLIYSVRYTIKFAINMRSYLGSHMENSRREAAFKADCADALKAAEPAKAAQDHRLRIQIRESESLISTLDRKILDIRQLLKSL